MMSLILIVLIYARFLIGTSWTGFVCLKCVCCSAYYLCW